MTLFLIVLILAVVSPFLYLFYEMVRHLRVIAQRLTKAEFQFESPERSQIKAPNRRQLKG